MRIVVLGAAAGGGFPQWNSALPGAARARAGDPFARPALQCSLALGMPGGRWVLLEASPDIRSQIAATPQLHPTVPPRSSPIAAVVVTSADIDHIAGLLSLRERQAFALYATERVLDVLAANSVFDVLDRSLVPRRILQLDRPTELCDAGHRPLGLRVQAFAVPGKVPLYLEDAEDPAGRLGTEDADVIGLELAEAGARCFYIPGCAALPQSLKDRLRGAALLFFDATLWRDDELVRSGAGTKTGLRMGHLSMSGAEGTMAALAGLGIAQKICIHMNDSNPLLLRDSAERREAEAAGWTVAYDGMELQL